MTGQSEKLRELAGRVTALLPGDVEDVVLTGSTARGMADELSDVELLAVSESPPDELPLEDARSWSPGIEGAMWYGGSFDGEKVEQSNKTRLARERLLEPL
ncbi:MAG TPA: nucleotidyltransferase domain-containing protein [Gaiellaceae bacterium]|nr:nucleotidyltransferase domain-containing protein [Gaiellaceae bacterium]